MARKSGSVVERGDTRGDLSAPDKVRKAENVSLRIYRYEYQIAGDRDRIWKANILATSELSATEFLKYKCKGRPIDITSRETTIWEVHALAPEVLVYICEKYGSEVEEYREKFQMITSKNIHNRGSIEKDGSSGFTIW